MGPADSGASGFRCRPCAEDYGLEVRHSADGSDVRSMDPSAMPPELLAAPANGATAERPAIAEALGDELLNREVGDFMTPGCVTVSEEATVAQAAQALTAHRVHGVLVLGAANGTPLGWVTARGLLDWLDRDRSLASARNAITEQATAIDPCARLRDALYVLSRAGTTHLLVRRKPHLLPVGVITDFDLAVAARR